MHRSCSRGSGGAGFLFGLVLVVAGSLLLAERMGALDMRDTIRQWWPLALIAVGLYQLVDRVVRRA